MTTNLKSLLIFSFLLCFAGVSYGQTGNSQGYDDRYFDERQMLIEFEAKATENIASKPYLNLEDARMRCGSVCVIKQLTGDKREVICHFELAEGGGRGGFEDAEFPRQYFD